MRESQHAALCKFRKKTTLEHYPLKSSLPAILIEHTSAWSDHPQIHMLYDSEAFVVVRVFSEHPSETLQPSLLPRHGFEIVDKRSGKEVYLDGAWAEIFQQALDAWEPGRSSPEEMEALLERYAQLAQNPVLLH